MFVTCGFLKSSQRKSPGPGACKALYSGSIPLAATSIWAGLSLSDRSSSRTG